MKRFITCFALMSLCVTTFAAPSRKVIDNGGSGPYKAEAISEPTLPGFVVYRPCDIDGAVKGEGAALPLFVFANGACHDTSLPYERMLNDIASYGYMVVALGEMQDSVNDRELKTSPNIDMIRAIEWAEAQTGKMGSDYYKGIDTEKVVFGGHSCGGAQTLANCADKHVKTCIMFNSGMGNISMADASKESLKNLHGPILYIAGGDGDMAYANAEIDYANIDNVPVAFANHLRAGHGGTFHEQYGGSCSRLARAWLAWQFKNKPEELDVFLKNRIDDFPDYTMKAKNFDAPVNDPFTVREKYCKSRDGKDIWGKVYIPNTAEAKKPLVVMAHGYNSSHGEPQAFAESLAMHGVASYIFDFCGGGNNSKSEGATTDMTIFTEKDNVEDITRTVKSWDFVDPERVALLGCSQGGLVAALTSAVNPDMFKSVVLVYPALSIPATAPAQLKRFDADNGNPQDVMGMKLGRDYYAKINGMNILDMTGKYKGNVLIVYGDKDPVTAGGMMDKAADTYTRCTKLMIPGGTHGFPYYEHHEKATKGIIDFILDTMVKTK